MKTNLHNYRAQGTSASDQYRATWTKFTLPHETTKNMNILYETMLLDIGHEVAQNSDVFEGKWN